MEKNEFNSKELLNMILTTSKELAEKGNTYAQEVLDIPESGDERQQKLDGLKKGAIASAILVGLLGTKGGRSLTGKAIKIGSVVALGSAAYRGYQHWTNINDDHISPIYELNGKEAQERAFLLISAMVSAANADGKLDDNESAILKREILDMNLPKRLFEEVSAIVDQPLSASELSNRVHNQAVASEVYMAARILIDDDPSAIEIAYIKDLVLGLGLDANLLESLDAQLT
jgi:uncharacterized membrane protein YebE (DUF533 family)